MREILFRGKRVDNGKWVEGYYHEIEVEWDKYEYGMLPTKYQKVITPINFLTREPVEVLPETVGQYTGLTDKNGTRIFEDDILLIEAVCSDPNYTKFVEQVIFHKGKFCVTIAGWSDFERTPPKMCEVIGNIFDNLELLEGSTE